MEFLTLQELGARQAVIRAAFNELLAQRTVAPKTNANQWKFLRLCLERTLSGDDSEDIVPSPKITQYKFEIEDKLRRHYLGPGGRDGFVFRLMHVRDVLRDYPEVDAKYPRTAEYVLLIRESRADTLDPAIIASDERALIEKVVAACIDAEFDAYQSLPIIKESSLLRWFHRTGAAYRDIVHTLTRVARRGWIITNPRNPSTKRLLQIAVTHQEADLAVVRTTEYWYLRWWSTREKRYRYPYRETNRQTYVLVNPEGEWLVEENIRPPPRSSMPHRS